MGTRLTGFAAALLLISGALQSAHGKERRSATRGRLSFSETLGMQDAKSRSLQAESLSVAGNGDVSSRHRNGKPAAQVAETDETAPGVFNFKLGAVTVRPAIGGIKGAQFSLGF